ncbi:MAG: glycoside hydrolase [Prolixibacteraceae bacterium]|jgi:polygalacturonase|nr:glycoside hydrolase [Prolixibacteraceae bacterium]MBT6766838.1 glycoside hydrolase [Prolixibacteraceae bacterium]MBT6999711.1 glycoside hydrolase [Prolixibacteraceae bacterium]MBT7394070.1 glycoside hydrolase [Prolixibacteraceae bacterium]
MKIKKAATIFLIFLAITVNAKDYRASLFGIESNGTTLNTTSIQKAIDFIHENGGGRLVFFVGRYVTGSIYLKSNVTIHLEEGAILVGSLNPFDYNRHDYWTSLVFAYDQENIGITGNGVIDGRGYQVANNVLSMIHKGIIKDNDFRYDRPNAGLRPHNIYFKGCKNVHIQGIILKDPASWNQQYDQCKNVLVENITVDSKSYWNNDGIDIVDCDSVIVRNCYIDAADDGICLKSHSPDFLCQNVLIYNNKVRTSANGIKFGTASQGGFKNIKIIKNTVFDTYRSAITFAAVDGGICEDIVVDSLQSLNTGNVFFLRIGERKPGKKGLMNNISISNVYAEVPATKPDAGYNYEGPVEDLPRNISPASIVGMSDAKICNVTLKNIEIFYPGGGNPKYAKVGLDELDKVPEIPANYPEFSMFKELPAWGFYIRHAKGITFENVKLTCEKEDYRTAIVLDNVHGASFKSLKVEEPGKKKEPVFSHNSSDVSLK